MIQDTMKLIMVLNFAGLALLVAILRWWQGRHGKLSDKRFALVLTGFWTLFILTTFYPLLRLNWRVGGAVELVLLALFWGVGYPWTRWLYRQFASWKR